MKRDEGSVQRLFSLFLIVWMVVLVGVLFTLAKAGTMDQQIEDDLMQANLSALLIDPYQYGETGELVFKNASEVKTTFEKCLSEGEVLDFRLYEARLDGVMERICAGENAGKVHWYETDAFVVAPDGTQIVSTSIYAKIAVPVKVGFGIEVTAIKEHCVDVIVSEEIENEET